MWVQNKKSIPTELLAGEPTKVKKMIMKNTHQVFVQKLRKDMCFVYDQVAKLYNKHHELGQVKSSQEYKNQVIELKDHHKEFPFWKVDETLFERDFYRDALLEDTDSNLREDKDINRYMSIITQPDSANTGAPHQ